MSLPNVSFVSRLLTLLTGAISTGARGHCIGRAGVVASDWSGCT